jgi:hypothetical protein
MLIVVKQLSHKIHIIFLVEQVHKSATMLQQLAALCSFCEKTIWKAALCWYSLWLDAINGIRFQCDFQLWSLQIRH